MPLSFAAAPPPRSEPARRCRWGRSWPTGHAPRGGDRQHVELLAVVDLLGDWREEIVYADRGRILISMSRHPATSRKTWLMQDPVYRNGVGVGSMGYYQIPLPGRDLATTR